MAAADESRTVTDPSPRRPRPVSRRHPGSLLLARPLGFPRRTLGKL